MKRVTFYPSRRRLGDNPNLLHVETELGIINIWVGLQDSLGRKVELISVTPDRYIEEKEVMVQSLSSAVRLVQLKKKRTK